MGEFSRALRASSFPLFNPSWHQPISETVKMLGKLLLTVDAIALLLGAPIADYNHTHIFNPRWPPHAKCVSLLTSRLVPDSPVN